MFNNNVPDWGSVYATISYHKTKQGAKDWLRGYIMRRWKDWHRAEIGRVESHLKLMLSDHSMYQQFTLWNNWCIAEVELHA